MPYSDFYESISSQIPPQVWAFDTSGFSLYSRIIPRCSCKYTNSNVAFLIFPWHLPNSVRKSLANDVFLMFQSRGNVSGRTTPLNDYEGDILEENPQYKNKVCENLGSFYGNFPMFFFFEGPASPSCSSKNQHWMGEFRGIQRFGFSIQSWYSQYTCIILEYLSLW